VQGVWYRLDGPSSKFMTSQKEKERSCSQRGAMSEQETQCKCWVSWDMGIAVTFKPPAWWPLGR
jgi:hypothetical protein